MTRILPILRLWSRNLRAYIRLASSLSVIDKAYKMCHLFWILHQKWFTILVPILLQRISKEDIESKSFSIPDRRRRRRCKCIELRRRRRCQKRRRRRRSVASNQLRRWEFALKVKELSPRRREKCSQWTFLHRRSNFSFDKKQNLQISRLRPAMQ